MGCWSGRQLPIYVKTLGCICKVFHFLVILKTSGDEEMLFSSGNFRSNQLLFFALFALLEHWVGRNPPSLRCRDCPLLKWCCLLPVSLKSFLFVLSTPKQSRGNECCRPSSFTCGVTSPVALLTLQLRGTPLWKKVVLCIDDPVCVHSHFMAVLILRHRLIVSVLQAAWKITRFPHALCFVSVF